MKKTILFFFLVFFIAFVSAHGEESEEKKDLTLSIITISSIISGIFVIIALLYKNIKDNIKIILFLGIIIPVIIATFYTAYYIGALGLFAYGAFGGKDLVGKWGYKKSIVYGLLFSAIGAAAMIIAVNANMFAGMLVGLFIVALGFSLQQTAAQPFAI